MAFSALNKNFLSILHKLDINVKQFPDKSFDGSFDFVSDSMCHFFNWFLENITPENALTQTERAMYYILESTHSLPDEDQINFVLSSCQPSFEELMSMDLKYVHNFLPQELDDLKRYQDELSDVQKNLDINFNKSKDNQITLKKIIKDKKQKLNQELEGFAKIDSVFKAKVNEVKLFLLKQPSFYLKIELFRELLAQEGKIYNKLKTYELLDNQMWDSSKLDLLPELEKNLTYVEVSNILTKGFLLVQRAEVDFLLEFLHKKSPKSSTFNYLTYSNEMECKLCDEIKILESELFGKEKKISHDLVQNISEDYLLSKTELFKSYVSKLMSLHEYLRANCQFSSCLLHILLKCSKYLEKTISSRKPLQSKLNEYETYFSSDITNLELRQQRFSKIITCQNHPLLSEVENSERFEESLKNFFDLMSRANQDSDYITWRSQLQSSIKGVFYDTLCGPTDELLLIPMELLVKFQDEKDRVGNLSQGIKRQASKYVETKEKISKQQRKELLAWISFITNSQID